MVKNLKNLSINNRVMNLLKTVTTTSLEWKKIDGNTLVFYKDYCIRFCVTHSQYNYW